MFVQEPLTAARLPVKALAHHGEEIAKDIDDSINEDVLMGLQEATDLWVTREGDTEVSAGDSRALYVPTMQSWAI
jgi:hypothetical protein